MEGRVHDAKGGGLGVEHDEAGMVLGGEHDVADAGKVGESSPIHGLELIRVEGFGQFAEEAVGVVGGCAYQGMADDHAELTVHAPVDEEAEALIAKPVETVLSIQGADFRVVCCGVGECSQVEGQEEDREQTQGSSGACCGHGGGSSLLGDESQSPQYRFLPDVETAIT